MPWELKEIIKIYEDVIDDLTEFYKYIEIANDPIKVFETYRHMLLNSYLSSGTYNDFITKELEKMEYHFWYMDFDGSLILANYGTCRHLSDFLFHIYDRLGYISSQLFVYHPDLKAVVQTSDAILTNEEAQLFVDRAESDVDVHSDKPLHFERKYDDILVIVDYKPPTSEMNHTVNIIKKKGEERIYILDPRTHRISDVIDEKEIISYDIEPSSIGFAYHNYVHQNVAMKVYYGTDYEIGLGLLNNFDTKVKQDIMTSVIYQEKVGKLEEEYKRFKKRNQEKYDIVFDDVQRLIKKVG